MANPLFMLSHAVPSSPISAAQNVPWDQPLFASTSQPLEQGALLFSLFLFSLQWAPLSLGVRKNPLQGSGRHPGNGISIFNGSAKSNTEFRCLHWSHHCESSCHPDTVTLSPIRCHPDTCTDPCTQSLFPSFTRLKSSSFSGCWSPSHSECLFYPTLLVLDWSIRKVSALASFPLLLSSSRSSLLHVAPLHSLNKTETLWQVLTGKLEFQSCRFWQKPPRLASALSSSFSSITPHTGKEQKASH